MDEVRVIKTLRSQLAHSGSLKRRFSNEAMLVSSLKHPNVVEVHDFGFAADNKALIVMEYIDGVNLADLLRVMGPPSVELTVEITCQVLEALEYLHQHQIVHRGHLT